MSESLRVDVVFDFVCPWCYIGKRRLEAALEVWRAEHAGGREPVVRWLPFQLNPDIPAGGISRREYMERKHGPAGPDPEKQVHVAALGRDLGLVFEGWLVNRIRERARMIAGLPKVEVSPDPADNFLLGIAQAAGAGFLVSGDKAGLLMIGRHRKTRIVSVADFVAELEL